MLNISKKTLLALAAGTFFNTTPTEAYARSPLSDYNPHELEQTQPVLTPATKRTNPVGRTNKLAEQKKKEETLVLDLVIKSLNLHYINCGEYLFRSRDSRRLQVIISLLPDKKPIDIMRLYSLDITIKDPSPIDLLNDPSLHRRYEVTINIDKGFSMNGIDGFASKDIEFLEDGQAKHSKWQRLQSFRFPKVTIGIIDGNAIVENMEKSDWYEPDPNPNSDYDKKRIRLLNRYEYLKIPQDYCENPQPAEKLISNIIYTTKLFEE